MKHILLFTVFVAILHSADSPFHKRPSVYLFFSSKHITNTQKTRMKQIRVASIFEKKDQSEKTSMFMVRQSGFSRRVPEPQSLVIHEPRIPENMPGRREL